MARWFEQFQEGRRSMEDVHTDQPSTNSIVIVLLFDKDRQTIRVMQINRLFRLLN